MSSIAGRNRCRCRPSLYSSCGGTIGGRDEGHAAAEQAFEQCRRVSSRRRCRRRRTHRGKSRACALRQRSPRRRAVAAALDAAQLRVHLTHEAIEMAALAPDRRSEAKNMSISRVLPRPTPPQRYRPRGGAPRGLHGQPAQCARSLCADRARCSQSAARSASSRAAASCAGIGRAATRRRAPSSAPGAACSRRHYRLW